MAKCPFATWDEVSGGLGAYTGGPFKVVHHTTEGHSYAAARSAYKAHRSDPHFTVAGETIFQHIDTAQTARSLKNAPGGAQTNRDSAVQIEVVGFAGQAKDVTTLMSVAKLCRWIEGEHDVSQNWPNGRPRHATNGSDPGGHNRNAEVWDATGGHYGHSQVPENDHWDPGYTAAELAIVTPDAVFDPHDELDARISAPSFEMAAAGPDSAAPVSAEDIVNRVMARLMTTEAFEGGKPPARVTVRVSAGGVDIEVTVDRSDRDKRSRPVARSSRKR